MIVPWRVASPGARCPTAIHVLPDPMRPVLFLRPGQGGEAFFTDGHAIFQVMVSIRHRYRTLALHLFFPAKKCFFPKMLVKSNGIVPKK